MYLISSYVSACLYVGADLLDCPSLALVIGETEQPNLGWQKAAQLTKEDDASKDVKSEILDRGGETLTVSAPHVLTNSNATARERGKVSSEF
jgi:hypothetical protein